MRASRKTRRGVGLLLALLVMVTVSTIVVTTLDTTTLQYAAMRNTLAWDRARYMAEAGAQHALAELEEDSGWRTGIPSTEFPTGSGCTYSVIVTDGASDTILVTATGTAGGVTRRLQVTVQEQ